MPGLGASIAGARKWYVIAGLSFQPSEPAKIALASWGAHILARVPPRRDKLIVLPLLALSFGIAGMFGAYIVGVVWQGIDPGVFYERIEQFIKWNDIRMLLVKSAIFGLIVSTICCKKGYYASGGARGVGEATAKAVVASIVAIFAADYVTTSLMTDL